MRTKIRTKDHPSCQLHRRQFKDSRSGAIATDIYTSLYVLVGIPNISYLKGTATLKARKSDFIANFIDLFFTKSTIFNNRVNKNANNFRFKVGN